MTTERALRGAAIIPGGKAMADREATGPPSDEGGLLAALKVISAGDNGTQAAEDLGEAPSQQVFASFVRLTGGDGDLAADLTQETYRKAWQSLPRFERRSQLATWLYRIAYNTYLNHIRRPARVRPIEDLAVPEARDPDPDQEETLSRREARLRLRRAVIGLPEDLRFTVAARFWGELPVAEIARLEDVTGAAIRKRLKKAIVTLRRALEEDAA